MPFEDCTRQFIEIPLTASTMMPAYVAAGFHTGRVLITEADSQCAQRITSGQRSPRTVSKHLVSSIIARMFSRLQLLLCDAFISDSPACYIPGDLTGNNSGCLQGNLSSQASTWNSIRAKNNKLIFVMALHSWLSLYKTMSYITYLCVLESNFLN